MNYKCTHNYPGGPDIGYISKPHKVQPEIDENCHYYNHNWFDPKLYPEFWEKVKEPLLITHDGFEIFNEGVPVIVYSTLTRNKLYTGIYFKSLHNDLGSDIIIFVDPNNANNWIEENKPQYSKKDMIDFATDAVETFSVNAYRDQPKTVLNTYNNWLLKPKK